MPAFRLYVKSSIFFHDVPRRLGKSSNGGKLRRATGISPLRGSLQAAPTGCGAVGNAHDFMAGQAYRSIAGRRLYRWQSDNKAGRWSLVAGGRDEQAVSCGCPCFLCPPANYGAPARWLALCAAMGMCLMNVYAVFKVRPVAVTKRKTGVENFTSPVSTLFGQNATLVFNFFYFCAYFFSCALHGRDNCLPCNAFHRRNLLVCKAIIIAQQEPPPLYLWQVFYRVPQCFIA